MESELSVWGDRDMNGCIKLYLKLCVQKKICVQTLPRREHREKIWDMDTRPSSPGKTGRLTTKKPVAAASLSVCQEGDRE